VNTAKTVENFEPTTVASNDTVEKAPINTVENYITDSLAESMASDFLRHTSTFKLAKYLFTYFTQSAKTLTTYACGIRKFSEFVGKSYDALIAEEPSRVKLALEDFVGHLKGRNLSQETIRIYVKSVQTFYRANGITVALEHPLPRRTQTRHCAATPDQVQDLIAAADLRGKVIVKILASSGVRIGTLAKLTYGHVRDDLEKNITPIHIHVEKEIVKGQYSEYDTFLNAEAAHDLKLYLDARRRGTLTIRKNGVEHGIPPETITDDSPLIRGKYSHGKVTFLNPISLSMIVSKLCIDAGLGERHGRRRNITAHSLRRFFRTQLGDRIPTDDLEYMLGHKNSTYVDTASKGVEQLRKVYRDANFTIGRKTTMSKFDQIRQFVINIGEDPDVVLSKEAQMMPHRAVIGTAEEQQTIILQHYLRRLLKVGDENGG
jgi:integrase